MFITKKKFENAIHEAKHEVAEKWEKKLCEMDERHWRDNETRSKYDYYETRFAKIEQRIIDIEKYTGMVEEKPCCRCANAVAPARF